MSLLHWQVGFHPYSGLPWPLVNPCQVLFWFKIFVLLSGKIIYLFAEQDKHLSKVNTTTGKMEVQEIIVKAERLYSNHVYGSAGILVCTLMAHDRAL